MREIETKVPASVATPGLRVRTTALQERIRGRALHCSKLRMPKFVHSACPSQFQVTSKNFYYRAFPRVSECKQGSAQAGHKLCTVMLAAVLTYVRGLHPHQFQKCSIFVLKLFFTLPSPLALHLFLYSKKKRKIKQSYIHFMWHWCSFAICCIALWAAKRYKPSTCQ